MTSFITVSVFIDLIGFAITLSTLAIVINSSSLLIGRIRQGFLSLSFGLGIIAFSFIYSVVSKYWVFLPGNDFRSLLLSVGMIFLLLASQRLFYFHRKQKVTAEV